MSTSTPGRHQPPAGYDDEQDLGSRYGRRGSTGPLRPRIGAAARDARSALALLRERAWIGALLGVIVLSVVFVFLGRWQYHRHVSRSATNDLITSNYAAAPVPLEQLLPGSTSGSPGRVPYALQWRSARMSGQYLAASTVLIRNRPYSTGANDSQNGYEVVVPFQLASGTVILLNRGWIPAGDSGATRPGAVPAPPPGPVQVVARLRPSEPASTRTAPPGQALRINPGQLAAVLPASLSQHLIRGFAVLDSETPRPADPVPSQLDPPDPGIGINLAYAVQWVLFAIAAYLLLGVAGVKEIRRRSRGGLVGRG